MPYPKEKFEVLKNFPDNYRFIYNLIDFLKENITFELNIEGELEAKIPEYNNASDEEKQEVRRILAKTHPARIMFKEGVKPEDVEINLLDAIRMLKHMKKIIITSNVDSDLKLDWKQRLGKISGFFEVFLRRFKENELNYENYNTLIEQFKLLKIHLSNLFDFFIELEENIYHRAKADYQALSTEQKSQFVKELSIDHEVDLIDQDLVKPLVDRLKESNDMKFLDDLVTLIPQSMKVYLYKKLEDDKDVTWKADEKGEN